MKMTINHIVNRAGRLLFSPRISTISLKAKNEIVRCLRQCYQLYPLN